MQLLRIAAPDRYLGTRRKSRDIATLRHVASASPTSLRMHDDPQIPGMSGTIWLVCKTFAREMRNVEKVVLKKMDRTIDTKFAAHLLYI